MIIKHRKRDQFMKKPKTISRLLNLLAMNDYLRKQRMDREKNLLYENRLKQSETKNEKDRAFIRRIMV